VPIRVFEAVVIQEFLESLEVFFVLGAGQDAQCHFLGRFMAGLTHNKHHSLTPKIQEDAMIPIRQRE
jgi:hypothetical protein